METKTIPTPKDNLRDVARHAERIAFNLDLLQAEAGRLVRFAAEMRQVGAL